METRARPLQTWPFRYELIEGLRGLAALVVVMHHLQIAPPIGHYAVMLFFVISGYCIAAATEAGRRRGMGFGTFMLRRLHRIYPPYFFALVFYVITRVAKAASGGHNDLDRPWLDWVMNLTMTQWLYLPFHPAPDTAVNPRLLVTAFWSLNYEDQFYLVMGIALLLSLYRGVAIAVVISALAAAGLIWNLVAPGGWITGFFLEYWVHFALGALLFYVLCLYPQRRTLFLTGVIILGLFSAMRVLPWAALTVLDLRAYTEFVVVCGFTLFLYFARPMSGAVSRSWIWRPIAALGTISYSLYLIHQFNLTLVTEVASRLAPHAWEPLKLALMLGLEIGLASVFWYFCERPFLNRGPRNDAGSETAQSVAGNDESSMPASAGIMVPDPKV
jgi:peptidoglycan/LPS O-acetylase OafA/YrhL